MFVEGMEVAKPPKWDLAGHFVEVSAGTLGVFAGICGNEAKHCFACLIRRSTVSSWSGKPLTTKLKKMLSKSKVPSEYFFSFPFCFFMAGEVRIVT